MFSLKTDLPVGFPIVSGAKVARLLTAASVVGLFVSNATAQVTKADGSKAEEPTCAALDFFDGLEVISADGVPALKTKWAHAYTKPLVLTDSNTKVESTDLGKNYQAYAFSFSTNTFTNTDDPLRLQLLFRGSSLYNLYFNAVGMRFAKPKSLNDAKEKVKAGAQPLDCNDPILNRRLLATDRMYFGRDISAEKYQFFFSNGLGFRGVSGKVDGNGTTKGLGTLYLGFGIDGPLYSLNAQDNDGFASVEAYLSYNRMNKKGMELLAGAGNGFASYTTLGLELELAVQKKVSIKLSYAKAIGGQGKAFLGDLVAARIAMNK